MESNLGALHAAWCYTFWVSAYLAVNAFIHIQQLHLEGRNHVQLSAGKQSLFPFKKPSEAGTLAVLVHLVPWVQTP